MGKQKEVNYRAPMVVVGWNVYDSTNPGLLETSPLVLGTQGFCSIRASKMEKKIGGGKKTAFKSI